MQTSSTAVATVSCKERFRCEEPLYKNTQHCVLHFPSEEKTVDFTEALKKKLRDGKRDGNFDFLGVWFPETDLFKDFTFNGSVVFQDATFSAEVDFGSATFEKPVTFRSATFNEEADFGSVTFKAKAHFRETKFRKLAEFTGVTFEKDANFYRARFLSISRFSDATFIGIANFDEATFQGRTNFNSAVFAETVNFVSASFQDRVLFDATKFKGVATFLLTNFKDYVRFRGYQVFPGESPPNLFPGEPPPNLFPEKSPPNLRGVSFDKPELVSFHSLTLRPYWFVDVNASEFALTNVNWDWRFITVDREIDGIKNYKDVLSPYPLLGIACWNLAVNAEDNHRYEEASKFRYLAMEARRRGWKSSWGSVGILHWLYWLLSGYGERIVRALMVLIGIWLVFGGIYATTLRDKAGTPLRWRDGLSYSAAVMMLQKPEPPPATAVGQGLVILEAILGPVQAALLALAIRRKFMR